VAVRREGVGVVVNK